MSSENVEVPAARAWRLAGERVLELGAALGPTSEDEFGGLAESRDAGEFDQALEEFKRSIDDVLAGREPTRALSLVGSLAVVDDLMARSAADDFGGLSADRGDAASAVLADYEHLMTADASSRDVEPLPEEFGAKLDALQEAGADELVALGTSEIVVGAFTGAVTGLAQIGGAAMQQAFDAIGQAVNVFRAKVIGFLKWLVERLRSWLPESFRETFDEKLDDVKEWIQGRAGDAVAELLGRALGRRACEQAWEDARDKKLDLSDALAKLDDTVEGELGIISGIGSAREKLDGIASHVVAWVGAAVPQVRLVVGLAAAVVVAVVMYQVDEGFDQIGALVA